MEYFPTLYTNFYLHFSIHSRNSHECMFTTTRQINIRLGVKKKCGYSFLPHFARLHGLCRELLDSIRESTDTIREEMY